MICVNIVHGVVCVRAAALRRTNRRKRNRRIISVCTHRVCGECDRLLLGGKISQRSGIKSFFSWSCVCAIGTFLCDWNFVFISLGVRAAVRQAVHVISIFLVRFRSSSPGSLGESFSSQPASRPKHRVRCEEENRNRWCVALHRSNRVENSGLRPEEAA